MVAKKNTKRKHKKSQTSAGKKTTAKKTASKKLVMKEKTPRRVAKKKAAQKKAAVRKVIGKKTSSKTASVPKKQLRKRSEGADRAFLRAGKNRGSGRQSGDLQGLSIVEGADSESVGELLEEGNAFEADAVKGVEDAGDGDVREVRTHEVPEDDVPSEYLEKE